MFVCSFFPDIPNVILQVYESSIAASNNVYSVNAGVPCHALLQEDTVCREWD